MRSAGHNSNSRLEEWGEIISITRIGVACDGTTINAPGGIVITHSDSPQRSDWHIPVVNCPRNTNSFNINI